MSTPTRPSRWATATLACALAAAPLAGCSWFDAATTAADDLREQFETDYDGYLVSMDLESPSNLYGGGGWLYAVAWFEPDTPDELLEDALQALQDYAPEHVTMHAGGVVANGVGLCPDDPQVEAKRQLRAALAGRSSSLAGTWGCSMRPEVTEVPYGGDWADLVSDTGMVDELGLLGTLTMEADLGSPRGTVSGPWQDVPISLAADALAQVENALDIHHAALTPGRLAIQVQPTTDVLPAQEAAQELTGDRLEVTIVNGTGAGGAAGGEEIGPMLDAIRRLPGVGQPTDTASGLMVQAESPEAVAALLLAAAEYDSYEATRLQIMLPSEGVEPGRGDRFIKPAGSTATDADVFAHLLEMPELTWVSWVAPMPDARPAVTVAVEGDSLAWVPALKAAVPEGSSVSVSGLHITVTITFPATQRLSVEDVDFGPATFDPSDLVAAWNGAGR